MKKSVFNAISILFLASCSVMQPQNPEAFVDNLNTPDPIEIPDSTSKITDVNPLFIHEEGDMPISATKDFTNVTTDLTNQLKVTYIGNSGFLITTNHKKVIIDGLFHGFEGIYTLPEEVQNKLAQAQPPFDNIDVILVSHNHRDHFSFGLVDQHLKTDPNTVLASLPIITAQFKNYSNRLVNLDPTPDEPVIEDIAGIQVEALSLSHGQSQPKNIGFVITIDGYKLFYSGDIDITSVNYEIFKAYGLPEKKLDIAFIQHFYLTDIPEEQQFIKQGIAAKYLIPTHYFYTTPPFNRETVKNYYPDAILFDAELSSWTMPSVSEITE